LIQRATRDTVNSIVNQLKDERMTTDTLQYVDAARRCFTNPEDQDIKLEATVALVTDIAELRSWPPTETNERSQKGDSSNGTQEHGTTEVLRRVPEGDATGLQGRDLG
jgi:hypothetical protein